MITNILSRTTLLHKTDKGERKTVAATVAIVNKLVGDHGVIKAAIGDCAHFHAVLRGIVTGSPHHHRC